VNAAALLPGGAIDLAQRLPEAEVAVADRELGTDLEPAVTQIDQQLAPGLLTLPVAIGEPDQLLAAPLVGTDHDQDALALLVEPSVEVHAVDPEVDVALAGEVALLPGRQLGLPGLLQPADGRGGQPWGVRPSSAVRASLKSPLEMPFRYSQGRNSSSERVRRR
jgi:hypothetical protein